MRNQLGIYTRCQKRHRNLDRIPIAIVSTDEESTSNIHGESEITPEEADVVSEEDRKARSYAKRQKGKYSWLSTLVALCVVHAVLLVTYGVHSKWQWATQLTESIAGFTLVLFC